MIGSEKVELNKVSRFRKNCKEIEESSREQDTSKKGFEIRQGENQGREC